MAALELAWHSPGCHAASPPCSSRSSSGAVPSRASPSPRLPPGPTGRSGGRGAGGVVAQATKSRKGGAKANPGKPAQRAGAGFGTKGNDTTSRRPDSLSLLRRSEQLYQTLLAEMHRREKDRAAAGSAWEWEGDESAVGSGATSDDEPVVREYVICARAASEGSGARGVQEASGSPLLPDWLPVAELLLVSGGDAADDLPKALPFVCREIAECACLTLGSSFPRHVLEFAYESAESFYDEVATAALGFGNLTSENDGATCPYTTLGVPKGAPLSQIRAAYRTLAAQHHPDRHDEEVKPKAEEKFKAIAEAYDKIRSSNGSAVQGSLSGSYAALGGPKRQGLSAPLTVRPSKGDLPLPAEIQVAVRPLEPELVEVFLARISRRSSLASVAA